jgi:FkbM family methyltransferase
MDALTNSYKAIVPQRVRDFVWHLRGMATARSVQDFHAHLNQVRPTLRIALGKPFARVSLNNLRLRVDCRDIGVGRVLYSGRSYEPDETALLNRILKPGMVFFDIGANIGYFTTLAARLVGPTGRVLAAEPDPDNFRLLEHNVRENRLDNVVLFNCALGAQAGEASLFRSTWNNGDHRLYTDGYAYRDSVTVPVRTYDDLLSTSNLDRVDAVKMDVQGYEHHVLAGMDSTLSSGRDLLMLTEFWPQGIEHSGGSSLGFWERLAEAGFKASFIEKNGTLRPAGYTDVLSYLSTIVVHEGTWDASGRYVNLVFTRGSGYRYSTI